MDDGVHILHGPDPAEAFRLARGLGLHVRIEPHLDYLSTLSGGPYRWRKDMRIDPGGEYFDRLLRPLSELGPEELTLGSELDDSTALLPDRWRETADRLRGLGVASSFGHKLNHDWLPGDGTIRYLESLDYVALSWYVPDLRPLPEGYVIGELGLGSSDTSRPWHFDQSTFDAPEALAIRRKWYLERIDWLRTVRSPGAACFWTAGHFDILGITHPEWRDEAVVDAVRNYNAEYDALR